MKVAIKKKTNPNIDMYRKEDLDLAYAFTRELHKEVGEFIKGAIIFGSAARKTESHGSDIDLLIVIDDLSLHLSPDLIEAYRIIVQKIIVKVSTRLHITTLRFTSFWDYVRNGDPIGINILRDGFAIIDNGFFEPLQILLRRGRIRPSPESIWAYFMKAPNTLHNSKWHILQGTIDLYWAVIDSAHAALMSLGEVPASPSHVADMMEEKMVKKKLLEKKYVTMMRDFYKLSKMVTHREISEIKGREFDRYHKDASDFVTRMRQFIKVK
ncbi:MAG: nucleotidyltransferase domain-containing protein [Nanoarchaeota archaeon]